MANPSDLDMSDFEKLADTLEFENKQYVKMIEKEKQCILSLQGQIKENKEKIQRVEGDISRMDEDTMRLHKQYVQSKETLKNLKDTYNVMMDHEMALSKQLQSLKIKSDEEKQYYQEQISNYSKIKDDYMEKYESFPLAVELRKKKEMLIENQKESDEMEAVITDLQEKIKEKEAVLDSKVVSRMIIKIARLKLSTLQTEKEIDECLVEKTSLLEQLKEIQAIQQPPEMVEINREEVNELSDNEKDITSMECEEEVLSDKHLKRKDNESPEIDDVELCDGVHGNNNNTDFMTPMECHLDDEKICDIDNSEENINNNKVAKSDSNQSVSSNEERIPSFRTHAVDNLKLNLPFKVSGVNQSTIDSEDKRRRIPSDIPEANSQISSMPQVEPVQRPMLKIPSFKPIKHYNMPPIEVPRETQVSTLGMSKTTNVAPKVKIPTFNHNMLTVPKLNVPKLPSTAGRYTNAPASLKEFSSARPQKNHVDRMQNNSSTRTSLTTPTTFSLPKFTESSRQLPTFSTTSAKPSGLSNISLKNLSVGAKSRPTLPSSIQLNQSDKDRSTKSTLLSHQPPVVKNSKVELPSSRGMKLPEQKRHHPPDEQLSKGSQPIAFSRSSIPAQLGKTSAPLFKPSTIIDAVKQRTPSAKPVQTMASPKPVMHESNEGKTTLPPPPPPPAPASLSGTPVTNLMQQDRDKPCSPSPSSFSMGSIFKPVRDNSMSPSTFSLINLSNSGKTGDSETPFMSFGGSCSDAVVAVGGDDDQDDDNDRPTNMLGWFNTPQSGSEVDANEKPGWFNTSQNTDESDAKENLFPFSFGSVGGSNMNEDCNDKEKGGSFFSFGTRGSEREDCNDKDKGGSFFNFGTGGSDSSNDGTSGGFLNFRKDEDDGVLEKKESFFKLF